MLEHEGWDAFTVVLGSDETCPKGEAHYEQIAAPRARPQVDAQRGHDRRQPRRTCASAPEHGVPVRIGIDRDGDPRKLLAAGATHVVDALRDVLGIIAVAAP